MPELIDSHCHLDFDVFDDDRDKVLMRARSNGIKHIIIPGVSHQRWSVIKNLCENNSNLHPCYGLHPYEVGQHSSDDINSLGKWIEENNCIAIGECGLDYRSGQPDKKRQLKFFQAQLDIAITFQLPVVIHSVHATTDVISCLQHRPGLKGMIHSYSGSYEQAMLLIDQGFYISFGGQITYDRAIKLRKTASKISLNHLLLETDAPDQADTDHRNQRNEPAYLINVLESLTTLRPESLTDIASQTTLNAKKLFNLE